MARSLSDSRRRLIEVEGTTPRKRSRPMLDLVGKGHSIKDANDPVKLSKKATNYCADSEAAEKAEREKDPGYGLMAFPLGSHSLLAQKEAADNKT